MGEVRLPPARTVGKWERLAIERQERDLDTARDRGLVFDAAAGDRAVAFFTKYLRHHKGEWAGKPLILSPWQAWAIRVIFGWQHADTGLRRFRKVWWEVPRKNGKTQLAAGVGLRMLAGDNEAGGEVYFTATKRDQAKIGHVAAAQMVRQSPDLLRFITVPKSYLRGGTLVCSKLGSKMEPLSSDHSTLDGLSPSCDIRDEVHAWTDHGLSDVLDTALGARRQPLTFEITTAGLYERESVGWTHHDYATKVLDGTFDDDATFAYIFSADEKDDPFDPATWWKANPGLGISVKTDYLAGQADKARREPSFLNGFLRLHLNVWTQQVTRWLSMDAWRACPSDPVNEDELSGGLCYGGLDLAQKSDLCSFVLAFPRPDGTVAVVPRFWLPEEKAETEARKGRRFYQDWARQGLLTLTPGNVIDFKFLVTEIVALSRRFYVHEIGFDPWKAQETATALEEHGITMVEIRQGVRSMSSPCMDLEARVTDRTLRHGGNPLLHWMAGNAVVRQDANGNIAPARDKATDKIDGIVALLLALSRFSANSSFRNVYAERGLLSL